MRPQLVLLTVLGLTWTTVTAMPCAPTVSKTPPVNVNSVRPSDVAVFSSIGLYEQSPELSSLVSRVKDLLALFNPALISSPTKETTQPSTLVEQAKEVSLQLQNEQNVEQWKLLLLFVQMDQLCACEKQELESSIKSAVKQVDDALQLLHSQLKHTIVSVALWAGENNDASKACSCMEGISRGEIKLNRALISHVLQESLGKLLVEKKWYSDSDDFTVILQHKPLIHNLPSDEKPLSKPETRQQTDDLVLKLWKNLLQPTSGQHSVDENGHIIAFPCPTEEQPFLRTEGNTPSQHSGVAYSYIQPFSGTSMTCSSRSPSSSVPTSVHKLRPADVNVVAAIGDSLTAGNGILSDPDDVLDVMTQYRGYSWSIGGQNTLASVTTLPNILKHFNSKVTGYSTGTGNHESSGAFLNQAVPGSTSPDLDAQVKALVSKMKSDSRINFSSDWKVITVLIGGNDVCNYCDDPSAYSATNFYNDVRDALDYLHDQVPRALVNLVEPIYIINLREPLQTESLDCPTWLTDMLCPCVLNPASGSAALETAEQLNRDYQAKLRSLVNSGRYDTNSDFTVVLQSSFRDIVIPRTSNGVPDRSYFSADCFHLSQKSQTKMALSLWNNMMEAVGSKTTKMDLNANINLKCPTTSSPYIRTSKN